MIQSILVGLDESEFSSAAIEFGIKLAREHSAMLVGVAVLCEPLFRDSTPAEKLSPSYKPTYEKLVGEAHDHCQRLLAKFAQLAAAAGVRHKTLEDVGLAAEQIAIEAQRFDLILLGQETHFHFEATTRACQTLQRLLHNPPRPVIAVPRQPLPGDGVLIAYDGSVAAARSLHVLVQTGLLQNGPVHVLAVDIDDAATADNVAGRAVEFLAYHGIAAHNIPVQSEQPPSQIIHDEALARGVRMIAMGAYGHGGVAEWLFGSTTKQVLQNAAVPLFLYH
jgi:nucleotide-binding universal stress UspA family protein